MSKFWYNKPVNIKLDKNVLQKYILKDLSNFNMNLDLVFTHSIAQQHIEFIQKYYYHDPTIKLCYSKSLLYNYLDQDSIILEAHSNNILAGMVVAKKINLYINKQELESVEINFLCIHPSIRNAYISSYLVNHITLYIINNWQASHAFYTIGYQVHPEYYSKKSMYHFLLNPNYLYQIGFVNNQYNYEYDCDGIALEFSPTMEIITHINEWNKREYTICEKMQNTKPFIYLQYNNTYMCFFQLDNEINGKCIKTAYIYKTNFKNPDFLGPFLNYLKHNNFDLVTTTLYFNHKYILKGSGCLYYYAYNIHIDAIDSDKNSLVTI